MKAARIHSFGGSEKVRVETVPLPRMRKNTALVRVRAAAVNPVDSRSSFRKGDSVFGKAWGSFASPQKTFLIHGASGGVGSFAAQFAN
jgi:NADPH:quinone reductase-like Zn-dependent oxidoreductase